MHPETVKRVFLSVINANIECLTSEELAEDIRMCETVTAAEGGICGCVSRIQRCGYRKCDTSIEINNIEINITGLQLKCIDDFVCFWSILVTVRQL